MIGAAAGNLLCVFSEFSTDHRLRKFYSLLINAFSLYFIQSSDSLKTISIFLSAVFFNLAAINEAILQCFSELVSPVELGKSTWSTELSSPSYIIFKAVK